MQHFTQLNTTEFQPNPMTLLLIKQMARMCNNRQHQYNGYNGLSVTACS